MPLVATSTQRRTGATDANRPVVMATMASSRMSSSPGGGGNVQFIGGLKHKIVPRTEVYLGIYSGNVQRKVRATNPLHSYSVRRWNTLPKRRIRLFPAALASG
jgi:hypothetical protein